MNEPVNSLVTSRLMRKAIKGDEEAAEKLSDIVDDVMKENLNLREIIKRIKRTFDEFNKIEQTEL